MEELKFAADLINGDGTRTGGHIYITDEDFIFKPHRINFGDRTPIVIPIDEFISGGKEGISFLYLTDAGNDTLAFYTFKGDKIINAIKERHHGIFGKTVFTKKNNNGFLFLIIVVIILILVFFT